ncbi:DUF1015 domain-containing protein [Rufibacter glacialis]|uniref:DUF1015 domain-containing protein n=1 Tax=Rufibacter glacialis TaxID=1259555 RepID=A0A5M8QGI8_9BACT|nr:DUF1015 domain-containing protein [Rufibacter glacialis]KAA6434261.1 DUF1015 domain-containing protein [Rufibacter glacialis]GGK68120.1 hypothetical protein GCM10011405_15200 [Rufibacter glacialis]
MAEILPIKGFRYNPKLPFSIDALTSPLFDVVSIKQRQALYRNSYNSIHLSVPPGPDPADSARRTVEHWKRAGILQQDPLPGIYVYYQYFTLPGSSREFCRKGFMCHIKAYPWEDQVILRHENTIPAAVNDRIALLEETQMHTSATHGLFTDPEFTLEQYMDESITSPLYESEDYQGVRDVLSVIHDAEVIQKFVDLLRDQQVILADGHHRYEGSLQYRQKMLQAYPDTTGEEPFHYHLMYLTNAASDDLRILPTHRLLDTLPLAPEVFLERLQEFFTVLPIADPFELDEIITGKKWAFGVYLEGEAYKVRLKPEVHAQLSWHMPQEVKDLDLTVMHYFILEEVLGIPAEEQRQYQGLSYVRSFAECLSKVDAGKAQLALITNEVKMEEVQRVCHSGAVMPQKSTFFYPKVICGFLFSSIAENEFH